jgi:tRNA-specific 2-thiouridylase
MSSSLNLHLPTPPAKTTIAVAMSGGVDSSVAAAMLVEAGYQVKGIMLKLWVDPFEANNARENSCCTTEAQEDAHRVAEQLGISLHMLDVGQLFRQRVVDYFIHEYSIGRTPNPCLMCNRYIRFEQMLTYAVTQMDADFLATGHYARSRLTPAGVRLLRGHDRNKDQSYVLSLIPPAHLQRLIFPVGHLTKPQVRALAQVYALPVAQKRESQDICFTSDYRSFLQRWAGKTIQPGPIVDESGQVLGQHRGLAFYTIGQRKGLSLNSPRPLFVLRLDAERNALVVGSRESLARTTLLARDVNWIQEAPTAPTRAHVQIRYRAQEHAATLIPLTQDEIQVQFDSPVTGIAPGQAVVFYRQEQCLGGGIIHQ